MRGATLQPFPAIVFPDDFNPRSPCGERRRIRPGQTHDGNISIHAPRAGSDSCYTAGLYNPAHFNPRSPCGERHDRDRHSGSRDAISIHAPRAGGDDVQYIHYSLFMEFQSTPPVRGATLYLRILQLGSRDFNPRPPCGGRLFSRHAAFAVLMDFNPRPPCGGRLVDAEGQPLIWEISIHAPRAGGDLWWNRLTSR